MANVIGGKFWALDTAGIIVDTPVFVRNIQVTWKVASAGALEITEVNRDVGVWQYVQSRSVARINSMKKAVTSQHSLKRDSTVS